MLVFALCAVTICGCGKDANYFSEVEDLIKSGDNIAEGTIKIDASGDALRAQTPMFADGMKITIKYKAQMDDDGNSAIDLAVKNQDGEFADLTTIVKYGNVLYFTTDGIIRYAKENGLDSTGQIESSFNQLGIEKAAKISIKDLCEFAGVKYKSGMFDFNEIKDDLGDYIEDMTDIFEDNFSNLTGKDGDDYTFTLDKNNVSKAVDDLTNIKDEDIEDIYDETTELFKKIFGSELTRNIPSYSDVSSKVKNAKKEAKQNKKELVKKFDDANVSIESKVNADDKTMSLSFGMSREYSGEFNISETMKTSSGDVDIKKMVPSDAKDLAAVLNSYKNQMNSYSNYNYNNSTATY